MTTTTKNTRELLPIDVAIAGCLCPCGAPATEDMGAGGSVCAACAEAADAELDALSALASQPAARPVADLRTAEQIKAAIDHNCDRYNAHQLDRETWGRRQIELWDRAHDLGLSQAVSALIFSKGQA